jgi:S-formylglutathione hydrolase FrmB
VSLTSTSLVVVLALVALAVVVVAVVLWPRMARTTVWTVLGRVALLVAVNVSVLLLVGAVLNDQFEFFSDWQDLLGSASTQAVTVAGGVGAAKAATIPVTPTVEHLPVGRATALRHVDGGTVFELAGPVSGVTSTVLVQLPDGYWSATNATRRYPVLVGFAGFPGTVSQLAADFGVADVERRLVAENKLGPVINVYPLAWVPAGRDTECVDGPARSTVPDRLETWSTVDVPAWVQATFRTDAARSSWATWGMSAGGYCAAMATMLHPSTFSAALVLAGYFSPLFGNWQPYPGNDPALTRYDLLALARHRPPPVALWVFVSRTDPLSYPQTAALVTKARAPLSVTAQFAANGGHRLTLWRQQLPAALTWLGASIPGFHPH